MNGAVSLILQIYLCQMLCQKSNDKELIPFPQTVKALQNPASRLDVSGSNSPYLGHIGGVTNAIVGQGNYAFSHFGPEFIVLDVANPMQIVQSSSFMLSGIVNDIAINNDLAYVATTQNLHVLDISDPLNLVQVSEEPIVAKRILVDGNYLYLMHLATLSILNVADLSHVGSYTNVLAGTQIERDILAMAKEGSTIYLAIETHDEALQLIDIADPSNPTPIAFLDVSDFSYTIRALTVLNDLVYFTSRGGELWVVDASNPGNLSVVGNAEFVGTYTREIQIKGNNAYLISPDSGLTIRHGSILNQSTLTIE